MHVRRDGRGSGVIDGVHRLMQHHGGAGERSESSSRTRVKFRERRREVDLPGAEGNMCRSALSGLGGRGVVDKVGRAGVEIRNYGTVSAENLSDKC